MLQTEYDFTLPQGYIDGDGALHRHGVMRLATAEDEILPLQDRRVRANPAYMVVILLSRVVTRLGTIEQITPKVIGGLFSADLACLQDLYNRINLVGQDRKMAVTCPDCGCTFDVEQPLVGGS
jgi:phage FluMu protein gp41